jgi:hypothetical protein
MKESTSRRVTISEPWDLATYLSFLKCLYCLDFKECKLGRRRGGGEREKGGRREREEEKGEEREGGGRDEKGSIHFLKLNCD